MGHYHGTLWKYNGMSSWYLYASYDGVWGNEVKWVSSNVCLKVGFSCLKTDLPSGIIWWQNQKLALKYVKNVLQSKMFSTFEGEWFVNQILVIPSSETQGRSVGSGEKVSNTGERAPGYRLSPNYFQKFKRMPAPDWAQKMLCIIVPNRRTVSPEFFSWVRTRRLLSRHTCPSVHQACACEGNFYFLLS